MGYMKLEIFLYVFFSSVDVIVNTYACSYGLIKVYFLNVGIAILYLVINEKRSKNISIKRWRP